MGNKGAEGPATGAQNKRAGTGMKMRAGGIFAKLEDRPFLIYRKSQYLRENV
jgi:hypothetical protein